MNSSILAIMARSDLPQYTVRILLGGIVALTFLLLLAGPLHQKYHFTKKAFFGAMVAIITSVTVALFITHAVLLSGSVSSGISQRTGQLGIFACGQQISIQPKTRFSPTAGNGSYSLSTDGTLRYVGYIGDTTTDATLGSFVQAVGGSISINVLTLPYSNSTKANLANATDLEQFVKTNPYNEKYLELRSGESCTITPSMVQVYVYKYDSGARKYQPYKITQHPELYQLSDVTFDRRDCVVLSYGDPRDSSKLTCAGYPSTDNIVSTVKDIAL